MLPALRARAGRAPLAAKVPEITALFWLIKLVTTFMGEATSDYLGDGNIAIAGLVEVLLVVVALWIQLRTRRYVAVAYWFLAMAVAVFGTGASDTLHIVLGIPYGGTTALWAIVLAGIFWRWYRSEGTLSIHSITTRRRERYYWATVFATFALGTALGDFTAGSLNLGFLSSGVLFGVVILIPAVAWRLGMNPIAAFWFAYVVTRPLGASFADYLSKPHSLTGANFGDGPTSAASAAILVLLVTYTALRRNDIQAPTAPAEMAMAMATENTDAARRTVAPAAVGADQPS
ncbi:hypothetical protein KDL01_03080 [Actinospica durhamensis]|uniref:Membrane-anchored protein n=1 Tax=Actinospica durhamensis TaxID=1508375 RepID=A0A941EK09_9ACTN|nr:hypothetical protein [Actinospica durhamensis]MBR7832225.1 hypothetical protein [Actinospica durhamensis]